MGGGESCGSVARGGSPIPSCIARFTAKDVRRRKLRCGLGTRCAVSIRCTVLDLAKRLPVCRYVGASTASTSNIHGTVERHRAVPDVLPWQGFSECSASTRTVGRAPQRHPEVGEGAAYGRLPSRLPWQPRARRRRFPSASACCVRRLADGGYSLRHRALS